MFSKNSKVGVLFVLAAFTIVVQAHFVLQYPASLGYNDAKEATGPCDTFDPSIRTNESPFPVSGEAIQVLTTHPVVTWNFNVALASNLSTWVPLAMDVRQTAGVGYFCFGQVPGKKEWVGQKAVIQIIQNAPDGQLYQCAAVTFTDSPPDLETGTGQCQNSSGFIAAWVPSSGSGSSITTSSSQPQLPSSISSVAGSSSTSSSEASSQTDTASSSAETATSTGGIGSGTTTISSSGATATTISNSKNGTSTSSGFPALFTGASYKIGVCSLRSFLGISFAALMALWV